MPGYPLGDDELPAKFSACVRFAGREPPAVDLCTGDLTALACELMAALAQRGRADG